MLSLVSRLSAVFILLALAGPALSAPRVAVSIAPIHSLVSALMEGVANPDLIFTGSTSPHHAALAPSQVGLIEQAELVIWVGPELEAGLTRAIRGRGNRPVLTLTAIHSSQLLAQRSPHVHGDDSHDDDHQNEAHEKHEHEELHEEHKKSAIDLIDPHLWLASTSASRVVDEVFEQLLAVDPDNGPQYQRNLQDLNLRLEQWRGAAAARLQPVANVPFMVFHDAYQYFEKEFSLSARASVTTDPERAVGVRRIRLLRQQAVTEQVRCLFSEPQFAPEVAAVVREGSSVRAGVLDPLGIDLPAGPDFWFQLMDQLVDDFLSCMAPA